MVLLDKITNEDKIKYSKIFSTLATHISLCLDDTNSYKFIVDDEVKFVFRHNLFFFVYWLDDNNDVYYDHFIINDDGVIIYVNFGDLAVDLTQVVPIFYYNNMCHVLWNKDSFLIYKQIDELNDKVLILTYDNEHLKSENLRSFSKKPICIDIKENGKYFNYLAFSHFKDSYQSKIYDFSPKVISYNFSANKIFSSLKDKGFLVNVPDLIFSFYEDGYSIISQYQNMADDIFQLSNEFNRGKL